MNQKELLTTWQLTGAREMLREISHALSPARENLEPGLHRVLDAIESMDTAEEKPRLRKTLEINFSYSDKGSPDTVNTILINGKNLITCPQGFVLWLDKYGNPKIFVEMYGGRLGYALNGGDQACP